MSIAYSYEIHMNMVITQLPTDNSLEISDRCWLAEKLGIVTPALRAA